MKRILLSLLLTIGLGWPLSVYSHMEDPAGCLDIPQVNSLMLASEGLSEDGRDYVK